MMVYGDDPDERVKDYSELKNHPEYNFAWTIEKIMQLAKWVMHIENYYSTLNANGARWMWNGPWMV